MNTLTPDDASKVIVCGTHPTLTDEWRAAAIERASRLLRLNVEIACIRVEVEHDESRDADHQFVAKGQVELGGPALLTSVATNDPMKSIDYLIDKLDHQLRRRARYRGDLDRPNSAAPRAA